MNSRKIDAKMIDEKAGMVESEGFIKAIIIPSRIEEIAKALEEFKAYFAKKGYRGENFRRLLDAIYEAISNAIIHGNQNEGVKKISIQYFDYPDKFQVKVFDEGRGFDALAIPDPRLPHNINKSHGRGLHIIKNSVDELSFNADGNEITMGIKK